MFLETEENLYELVARGHVLGSRGIKTLVLVLPLPRLACLVVIVRLTGGLGKKELPFLYVSSCQSDCQRNQYYVSETAETVEDKIMKMWLLL